MTRAALLALACLVALASEALAQADYPSRPVRIVVNSAPGGGTDILARVLAQQLSARRTRASSSRTAAAAAASSASRRCINAPPDGYTLLMTPSTVDRAAGGHQAGALRRGEGFRRDHPGRRHLQRAGGASRRAGARRCANLIALAKAKPGTLNYASAGAGSSPHMSMELLKHMAGIDLQHIPFKGTGPAMTEVLSGRIAALFSNLLTAKPLIEAGKLRALAVSGPKRVAAMPDVPTVAEAGVPGYSALQWYGLLAPAGTPQPRSSTSSRQPWREALRLPEVRERLAQDGAEPVGSTSAEFAALIKSELEKWATIARAANIQAE